MHAAAKDAWECAQGRDNGQNDPLTGRPFEKPAPVQAKASPAPKAAK